MKIHEWRGVFVADLFDYIYWRGDLPMRCRAFNPVDALILSWFSALPLESPVQETLGAAADALPGEKLTEETARLARMLAQSPRFREMRLIRFEKRFSREEETQFAALTVLPGDGTALVVFRGTDATLVGWKEDFNMAFSDEVPAQREAVRYLNEAAASVHLPLRVGGHSKGGNLAVYAAARCGPGVQSRIEVVYNFDGPGMNAAMLRFPGYRAIEARVETYLPASSVVGILLERAERYYVVRSDNVGAMQHVPDSWQVTPEGFELLDSLDWGSLFADRTLRTWLNSMSREERRTLVDTLYRIVEATGARTLDEVSDDWQESAGEMLGALSDLKLTEKAALLKALGRLIRSAVWNVGA